MGLAYHILGSLRMRQDDDTAFVMREVNRLADEFGLRAIICDGPTEVIEKTGLAVQAYDYAAECLECLQSLRQHCHRIFIYDDVILVQMLPTRVLVAQGVGLHSTSEPALEYADGTKEYYVRGEQAPAEFYVPGYLNAEMILEHMRDNIDTQSIAIEIYGWPNILSELEAEVIDEDEPHIGTLYEASLGDEPFRLLKCVCGTGAEVVLPVLMSHTTALEANRATFADEDDEADGSIEFLTHLEART